VSLGVPYEKDAKSYRLRATRELVLRVSPVPASERPNWETYKRIRQAQQDRQAPKREWVEALLDSKPRSVYVAQGVWLYLAGRVVRRWSLTEGDWPEDRASMQWKLRLDALMKIDALRANSGAPPAVAVSPWPPEPKTSELKLWAQYMEKRLQMDLTADEQERLLGLEAEVCADGTRTAEEWQRLLDEVRKMMSLRLQPHLVTTPEEIREMQALNREYSRRLKLLSPNDAEQMLLLKRAGHPADMAHLKRVMQEFDRRHPDTKGGGGKA